MNMCAHVAVAEWSNVDASRFQKSLQWLDDTEFLHSDTITDYLRRQEWLGGRILLRWLLSQVLCEEPESWHCIREVSGRLRIASPHFHDCGISLSRAPGIAVAAISIGSLVGIDVESTARYEGSVQGKRESVGGMDISLYQDAISWCKREAVAKGCGAGLEWALDTRCWDTKDTFRDPSGESWSTIGLNLPEGYTGAVAVPGRSSPPAISMLPFTTPPQIKTTHLHISST